MRTAGALDDILARMKFHITHSSSVEPDWPKDAVYRAEYLVKSWPGDVTRRSKFFTNAGALSVWYSSQVSWTLGSDNYFELDGLYMWDQCSILLTDVRPHIASIDTATV